MLPDGVAPETVATPVTLLASLPWLGRVDIDAVRDAANRIEALSGLKRVSQAAARM